MYDAPRSERAYRRDLPPRTSPSAAGWIALVIWALFAILAVLLAVGVVAIFSRYTIGLKSPADALQNLTFSQQSVIYDRNNVELARFGPRISAAVQDQGEAEARQSLQVVPRPT